MLMLKLILAFVNAAIISLMKHGKGDKMADKIKDIEKERCPNCGESGYGIINDKYCEYCYK